jgi:cytoskeletal protein RodZ
MERDAPRHTVPSMVRIPDSRTRFGGLAAVLGVTAIALGLASCGSSASTSSSTAAQSPTTTTMSTTATAPRPKARKRTKRAPKPTKHTTSTTTTAPPTTTTTQSTTTTTSKPTTTTPSLKPPVQATLVGDNHHPKVNQPWHYTVTVTDSAGHKLSGTETTEYTFGGVVVGTEKPANVKFTNGVYHDTIEFPKAAVGHPLDVQVVVHTSLGSKTLDWAIQVQA